MGYRATRHDDGTYTLHNVPVFLEHTLETDEGPKTVDKAWLRQAYDRFVRRLKGFAADGHDGGYLPPVHVEHSIDKAGNPQKTKHAGKLRLKPPTARTYEGREVACLKGDLTRIPEGVYAEIKAGRLPYLSVEVHDLDTPEIDSVALMESTVPFFRLPLLEVSKEIAERQRSRGPSPMPAYHAGRRPAHAYRARGRAARVLYRMDGGRLCPV